MNYFSAVPTGTGFGIGGPSPVSMAAGFMPDGLVFNPDNPGQYEAILKLADGFGPWKPTTPITVAQGIEDSVNLNNGAHDITISGKVSTSSNAGLRCITIKGGCLRIAFGDIEIVTPGTSEDVKLGDWSDQSYDYTDKIDLRKIVRRDGKRVRVVVGHAKWPITCDKQEIMLFQSLELKAYWWFKRLVRIILRIPKGVRDLSILP